MCTHGTEGSNLEGQKRRMETFLALCDGAGLIHRIQTTDEGDVGFFTKVNKLTKGQYKSGREPGDD